MGVSDNVDSLSLDKIPKRSSFFFTFKKALGNMITNESPKKEIEFADKKKMKDPLFNIQNFSEFHSKFYKKKSTSDSIDDNEIKMDGNISNRNLLEAESDKKIERFIIFN